MRTIGEGLFCARRKCRITILTYYKIFSFEPIDNSTKFWLISYKILNYRSLQISIRTNHKPLSTSLEPTNSRSFSPRFSFILVQIDRPCILRLDEEGKRRRVGKGGNKISLRSSREGMKNFWSVSVIRLNKCMSCTEKERLDDETWRRFSRETASARLRG